MGLLSKQTAHKGSSEGTKPGISQHETAGFFQRLISVVKKTAAGQGSSSQQPETGPGANSQSYAAQGAWQLDDSAFDTVGALLAQDIPEEAASALDNAYDQSTSPVSPLGSCLMPNMLSNPYRTSLSLDDMPGIEDKQAEALAQQEAPQILSKQTDTDIQRDDASAALAPEIKAVPEAEGFGAATSVTPLITPKTEAEEAPVETAKPNSSWTFKASQAELAPPVVHTMEVMGDGAAKLSANPEESTIIEAIPDMAASELPTDSDWLSADDSGADFFTATLENPSGTAPDLLLMPPLTNHEEAPPLVTPASPVEMPYAEMPYENTLPQASGIIDTLGPTPPTPEAVQEPFSVTDEAQAVLQGQTGALSPIDIDALSPPDDDYGILPGPVGFRAQQASNPLPEGVALDTLIKEDLLQFVSSQSTTSFQVDSNTTQNTSQAQSEEATLISEAGPPSAAHDFGFVSEDTSSDTKAANKAMIQSLFSQDNPALQAYVNQAYVNQKSTETSFEVVYDDGDGEEAGQAHDSVIPQEWGSDYEIDAPEYFEQLPLPVGDAYISFENNLAQKPVSLDLDEEPEYYLKPEGDICELTPADEAGTDETSSDEYSQTLDILYGSQQAETICGFLHELEPDVNADQAKTDDESVYELGEEDDVSDGNVLQSLLSEDLLKKETSNARPQSVPQQSNGMSAPDKPTEMQTPLLLEEVFVKDAPKMSERPRPNHKSSFEERILLEESRFTKNSIDQLINRYFNQD